MWMATHNHVFNCQERGVFGVHVSRNMMMVRSIARGVNISSPLCGEVQAYRMTVMARHEILGRIINDWYVYATGVPTTVTSTHEGEISKYYENSSTGLLMVPGDKLLSWKNRTPLWYTENATIYNEVTNIHSICRLECNLYDLVVNTLVFDTPDELYSSCYEPRPHDNSPTRVSRMDLGSSMFTL